MQNDDSLEISHLKRVTNKSKQLDKAWASSWSKLSWLKCIPVKNEKTVNPTQGHNLKIKFKLSPWRNRTSADIRGHPWTLWTSLDTGQSLTRRQSFAKVRESDCIIRIRASLQWSLLTTLSIIKMRPPSCLIINYYHQKFQSFQKISKSLNGLER